MTTTDPEPDSDTITVEAEYSHRNESHCQHWTFDTITPGEARDRVITQLIPIEATLHRYAVWYGTPTDRPDADTDTGTDFISLDIIEATTT